MRSIKSRYLGRQVLARKYRNADAKRLGGANERKLLFVNVLFDERAEVGRQFVATTIPSRAETGQCALVASRGASMQSGDRRNPSLQANTLSFMARKIPPAVRYEK